MKTNIFFFTLLQIPSNLTTYTSTQTTYIQIHRHTQITTRSLYLTIQTAAIDMTLVFSLLTCGWLRQVNRNSSSSRVWGVCCRIITRFRPGQSLCWFFFRAYFISSSFTNFPANVSHALYSFKIMFEFMFLQEAGSFLLA